MRRLRLGSLPYVLLATTLCAVGLACSRSATSPTPTAAVETAAICHRIPDTVSFTLTSMPASDVPPHLAHGDGRVDELVPGQIATKFGASCEFVPLAGSVITFDRLTGANDTPFTSYEEDGFTVTSTLRAWEVMAGHGHPAPAIFFRRPATDPDADGEVQVTSGAGLFVFSSVDLYSSVTPIPYVITGVRKSSPAFALTGKIPNTFGHFKPVSSPEGLQIDTLVIRLTNPSPPCCANPMGLDNIAIKR